MKRIDNVHGAITDNRVVEVFTFHVSRYDLGNLEQQALNYMIGFCMANSIDFKVCHSSGLTDHDTSIRVYVFDVPEELYSRFYVYSLRPVYEV